MIMIIKPEILSPDENGKANNANVTELIVKEGICIGNTGFNCFPLRPSLKGASKHVIMGDTGAMVDYRVARQGYALETQTAVIEYGFKELGCGMMSIDTAETNGPWRALMRTMGLGDGELEVHEGEMENEIHWKFDLDDWEKAKEHMKGNGKWLL
jgi:RimJ/RimL family protein N-acetyltransferase